MIRKIIQYDQYNKKPIKKILLSSFLIVTIILSFFSIIYAENTEIPEETNDLCFRPSQEFQDHIDMTNKIVTVLNSVLEKDKGNSNTNGDEGLISSKVISIKDTINWSKRKAPFVSKNIQNTIKLGQNIILSSFLNAKEGLLKDSRMGIAILFKKKVYLRDLEFLQDIDRELQNLVSSIIMKGLRNKIIDPKTLEEIKKIKSFYAGGTGEKLFKEFYIGDTIRYKTLIKMLMKWNGYMKRFISASYSNSDGFVSFLEGKKENLNDQDNGFKIIINTETIKQMTRKYNKLKKGGTCSNAIKNFTINIKNSKKGAQDLINGEAKKILKESLKRLKETMQGTQKLVKDTIKNKNSDIDKILTPQQKQILEEIHGIDTSRLTKGQGIGLKDLLIKNVKIKSKSEGNGKAKFKELMDIGNIAFQSMKKTLNNIKTINEKWETSKSNKRKDKEGVTIKMETPDPYTKKTTKLLKDIRNESAEKIGNEHKHAIASSAINEVIPNTIRLFTISESVYKVERIIGNKQNQLSINKTLTKICEKQCSNKGNKGCYGKL